MRYTPYTVVLLLGMSVASFAQEDSRRHADDGFAWSAEDSVPTWIGGDVIKIDDSGGFVVADGTKIQQWGLAIFPRPELSEFFRGKQISCRFLYKFEDSHIADCRVFSFTEIAGGQLLDVFAWFPQLGWAKYTCDSELLGTLPDRVLHLGTDWPYGYRCEASADPIRGEVIQ